MNPIARWKRSSQAFMTAWHYPDEHGTASRCGYPIPPDAEWAEGHAECPRCLSLVIDAETLFSKANRRKKKTITHEQVQEALEKWLANGNRIEVQPPEPTPIAPNATPIRNPFEEIAGML